MARVLLSATLAALAISMTPVAADVVRGACALGECTDGVVLLQASRDQVKERDMSARPGQRPDDMVPVPGPEAETPPPFEEQLDYQGPNVNLDDYNPLDRPLISDHTPDSCAEEHWPMFSELAGEWFGDKGMNFITVPQIGARGAPPGTPPPAQIFKKFLVQVNRYSEETTFTPLRLPVLNRGFLNGFQDLPENQSDQVLTGHLYTTIVEDLDMGKVIHEENGQLLHHSCRPANAFVGEPWQAMRMGSIPHGSQIMGYGNLTVVKTPTRDYYMQMLLRVKETYDFSVNPFVPGCGPEREQKLFLKKFPGGPRPPGGPLSGTSGADCCINSPFYMAGIDTCPAGRGNFPGCPEPIDMLLEEVKDLNVVEYRQLNLSTADTIQRHEKGQWSPGLQGGGIMNSAFVNINSRAPSTSFRNLMWLLTVQCDDGTTYELLQYIQVMNMNFLPIEPGCPNIMWPHVDANTLRRKEKKEQGCHRRRQAARRRRPFA